MVDDATQGQEDDEDKFETRYLDPKSIKEKKKQNKEAHRMMKLSLTDGMNVLEAIEYERLNKMDSFNIGQKLILKPPIEVRRGILFLTSSNVSYLGTQSSASFSSAVPAATNQSEPSKTNSNGGKASSQQNGSSTASAN